MWQLDGPIMWKDQIIINKVRKISSYESQFDFDLPVMGITIQKIYNHVTLLTLACSSQIQKICACCQPIL
jgi:hypothetical protein